MNRLCCPHCQLRFLPATATHLTMCPECGLALAEVKGSESLIGFRLFDPQDIAPILLPDALAVSLPEPDPDG